VLDSGKALGLCSDDELVTMRNQIDDLDKPNAKMQELRRHIDVLTAARQMGG